MLSLPQQASAVLLLLSVGWALKRFIAYHRSIRSIKGFPGYRNLGIGGRLAYFILPDQLAQVDQFTTIWEGRHKKYVEYGWNVISSVSYIDTRPLFCIADVNIIKQIGTIKSWFPKNTDIYRMLEIYGPNLVSAEGAHWTRLRKIVSPAFSEQNVQLVWEQTLRIVNDMFETDWSEKGDTVSVDHTSKLMKDLLMVIIMAAAYGQIDPWLEDPVPPPGHLMTFRHSLHSVLDSTSLGIKIVLPKWMFGSERARQEMELAGMAGSGWLGARVRETAIAYSELGKYMHSMILEQRTAGNRPKSTKRDLFSQLVDASSEDADGGKLSMDELFGNMYVFMLAGHETTAHTLTYLFALLALEDEEQEKLCTHIREVLGDRQPTYADLGKLDRVLAVFNEALRLYPVAPLLPKLTAQDVNLVVQAAVSEEDLADPAMADKRSRTTQVFIPKNTPLLVDVAGIHYDPRHWADPYAFKPDRFLQPNWPKDAFCPFFIGSRACIGRRFAEVEAIGIITLIVKLYKVSIDSNKFLEVEGESKVQRRERLLRCRQEVTLQPNAAVPLVFTKR